MEDDNIKDDQTDVEVIIPQEVISPLNTIGEETPIMEDNKEIINTPVLKNVEEIKEETTEKEDNLIKAEQKDNKKNHGMLWKILTFVFLFTTILLIVLLLSKKELMNVVLVGRGDNIQIYKIEKGKTINKPTSNEEGFLGWYYNDSLFDFNTIIDKDYIIIGKYDERATYTVTFNTDGGSEIEPIKIKEKELVKMPTKPTKEGYLFTEWTLDDQEYDFNTPVIKDIELKATWRIDDHTVIIRFDTGGGSTISSQKVKIDGTIKKPNNPTRSGFKFIEWQLNGETFDFNKTVNSDLTLVAKWEEKAKVTITFDSKGGSTISPLTVYEDEPVGSLPKPTKANLVFYRWVLDGKTFDSKSKISKNVTVVAEWKTIDETNYDKARSTIKSSYEITKNGQVINVTSKGCSIKHDSIKTTDKNITFRITCGSKKGTKTSKIILKLPTYKYTVTPSGNMVNSYVKINGVNSGTLYKNGSHIGDIVNGRALVNDSDIKGYPTLQLKITGDDTTYTVKKG